MARAVSGSTAAAWPPNPRKHRGQCGEQRRLQARPQPVGTRPEVGAKGQECEEEHEQPLAHEPDAPALGVEDDAAQDVQIEGGCGPGLEQRRLNGERRASRHQGD